MLDLQRLFLDNFYTYWRSWRPFLPDFMPTEDLGDPFFLILCLLKILVTNSCRFYEYWRSWRFNGDPFVLVSFQFPKIIVLVTFKKRSCRVCQFGDWRNGVDMKWYDYMKCNKEINYIFLKEKENCKLKVWIISVGREILIYKHTTGENMYM